MIGYESRDVKMRKMRKRFYSIWNKSCLRRPAAPANLTILPAGAPQEAPLGSMADGRRHTEPLRGACYFAPPGS